MKGPRLIAQFIDERVDEGRDSPFFLNKKEIPEHENCKGRTSYYTRYDTHPVMRGSDSERPHVIGFEMHKGRICVGFKGKTIVDLLNINEYTYVDPEDFKVIGSFNAFKKDWDIYVVVKYDGRKIPLEIAPNSWAKDDNDPDPFSCRHKFTAEEFLKLFIHESKKGDMDRVLRDRAKKAEKYYNDAKDC